MCVRVCVGGMEIGGRGNITKQIITAFQIREANFIALNCIYRRENGMVEIAHLILD